MYWDGSNATFVHGNECQILEEINTIAQGCH